MSRVQTRRSVSIRTETHDRLRAYCDANDLAVSQVVEWLVKDLPRVEEPSAGERWRRWAEEKGLR